MALVIVALSIGYYFVIYLPQQDSLRQEQAKHEQAQEIQQQNLANQQKCNKDASDYYTNFYIANNKTGNTWDRPEYHYNGQLNTCLLYVRYVYLYPYIATLSSHYNQVIDVYSNKTLLYGWFNRDTSVDPWKEDVGIMGNVIGGVPNYTSIEFFTFKNKLFSE